MVTSKCFWELWYEIHITHESLYSQSSGSLVSDPLNNVFNLGNGQVGMSRGNKEGNRPFFSGYRLSKPIKAALHGKPFSFRCALEHTYLIRFLWEFMYEKTQCLEAFSA